MFICWNSKLNFWQVCFSSHAFYLESNSFVMCSLLLGNFWSWTFTLPPSRHGKLIFVFYWNLSWISVYFILEISFFCTLWHWIWKYVLLNSKQWNENLKEWIFLANLNFTIWMILHHLCSGLNIYCFVTLFFVLGWCVPDL